MGGAKYGGGDLENRRYLTDGGNVLVCESVFNPRDGGRDGAPVVTRLSWRFLREGSSTWLVIKRAIIKLIAI